jgi:hypothetical protein
MRVGNDETDEYVDVLCITRINRYDFWLSCDFINSVICVFCKNYNSYYSIYQNTRSDNKQISRYSL